MGNAVMVPGGPESVALQHDGRPVCLETEYARAVDLGFSTRFIQAYSPAGRMDIYARFSGTPDYYIPGSMEKAEAS